MPDTLRLVLRSERGAVEQARGAVLDCLKGLALSPRTLFNIELVLEETIMNAVMHAHRGDHVARTIELNVQVESDDVVLRFEDDGIEFDPLRAVEPVRPATLQDAAPGGFGLRLVRRAARHIAYQRCDGRNVLTVRVSRR